LWHPYQGFQVASVHSIPVLSLISATYSLLFAHRRSISCGGSGFGFPNKRIIIRPMTLTSARPANSLSSMLRTKGASSESSFCSLRFLIAFLFRSKAPCFHTPQCGFSFRLAHQSVIFNAITEWNPAIGDCLPVQTNCTVWRDSVWCRRQMFLCFFSQVVPCFL
jgi:hypothetical protein